MRKLIKLFIALSCVFFLQNCENDDFNGGNAIDPETAAENLRDQQFKDENFGNTTTGKFIGTITDIDGNLLENVQITIENTVTMTDRNGVFILNDVPVFENFAYIQAKKDGFIDGSRVVTPKTEGANKIEIVLFKNEVTDTLSSGLVTEVSLPNGMNITFSGKYVTADGSPYIGDIDVVMHYVSPNRITTFTQMPGSLFAQNAANEARMLETYGMVSVNLFSPSGEVLNIDENFPAEIEFPIDFSQSSSGSLPDTIPLWHFDQENGYWKEDGQATRSGDKYVGEVTHFSWWNIDIPFEGVELCFNIAPTNAAQDAPFYVVIQRVFNNDYIYTGYVTSNQIECGLIPENEEIILSVYAGVGSEVCDPLLLHQETLGGYTADASVTISFADQFTLTPITGTATNCNGNPITNGYIFINASNTFSITDGNVDIAVQTCPNVTETYAVQIYDFDTNQWVIVENITMDGNAVNIGTVSTCQDTGGIYNGDIFLATQAEVDSFGAFNFIAINGDINIGQFGVNNGINDLTPLLSLENVYGHVVITNNSNLTDVSGLNNLVSAERLYIQSNESLTSVTALSNLTEVNGIVSIVYNSALLSLDGLEGITNTGNYVIRNNDVLTSINALQNLNTVGRLSINNNPLVNSLSALSNITTATSIQIYYMPALTSLQGLEQLTTVGLLRISYNDGLTDLAELSNVTTADALSIGGNNSLTSLNGLENLVNCNWMLIGKDLDFDVINEAGNNSLTDFCALQNLFTNGVFVDPPTSIFNGVYIANNPFNPSIQNIIDGNCSQ